MTNKNIHLENNTLRNIVKSSNNIKLNMHKGVLDGNIIKDPIVLFEECPQGRLDFSCENNSQYIPLI